MKFTTKFHLQLNSPNTLSITYTILTLFYILKQNKIFSLRITQTNCPLKIKKFTLVKSPHIFKTARTQFELRTLTKSIFFKNFDDVTKIQIFEKILQNLIKNLPITIKLKLKIFKLLFI